MQRKLKDTTSTFRRSKAGPSGKTQKVRNTSVWYPCLQELSKCLEEQTDELRHLCILRPSVHRRAAERKIHLAGQKDSRIRQLPHPEESKDCISPKILEIRKAEEGRHLRFCQQAAHDGIRRQKQTRLSSVVFGGRFRCKGEELRTETKEVL